LLITFANHHTHWPFLDFFGHDRSIA